MKTLLYILFIIVITFSACTLKNGTKPVAQGNAGDVLVVMNDENWNSEAGDSLRSVFGKYCDGLAYEEPLMDLHQIPYAKFVEQNLLHKNIIFYEIVKNVEKPNVYLEKDKYATGQIFVRVQAANQSDFVKAFGEKENAIVKLFLNADRQRWIEMFSRNRNGVAENQIKDTFNIKIKMPAVYKVDEFLPNFAWISYETRNTINGIFVYEYPLTDTTSFTLEYLIAKRNEVLKERVPGSKEHSYMTTETKFDYPVLNIEQNNGAKTAIIHGLWKVEGDFMGGPFVSYTKIDEARNRVVCVEGFVYEPNVPIRDKIRNVEGIVSTYSIE